MFTRVKTQSEIVAMRDSGSMLAAILSLLEKRVEAGITARELAVMAERELRALGGEAPFLGYGAPTPFPDVICISLNDQVVHGIPSDRVIEEGDIVSLDFGVKYKGMITDSALSVIAGKPKDPRHSELVEMTEKSMLAGINTVRDGVRTGDIGAAIEIVLNRKRYGIVRDLVGHGVGHHMHEDPNIPNYGRPGSGPELHAGMTIAIEPMATLGSDSVYIDRDGWTILTRDGSWAAHFEHTVLITDDGVEILTARKN
jgi:methionyl aminopeptidase